MSDKIIRKIAVIFVTDVVSFSKLMERDEDQTLQSFRACKAILDNLFQEHSGRIFNTAGDSVLAEFPSAVSAVICAAEFQKLIKERNASVDSSAEMHFRVGLNMGDVIVEGDNLYGDGVNVAARLEALDDKGNDTEASKSTSPPCAASTAPDDDDDEEEGSALASPYSKRLIAAPPPPPPSPATTTPGLNFAVPPLPPP